MHFSYHHALIKQKCKNIHFIRTLVTHFCHLTKTNYLSHQFYHSPCTYKLGQFAWFVLWSLFPFQDQPFKPKMCKSFKLKTNIASQDTQNWDTKNGAIQYDDMHSQYLSNTSNTYLLLMGSSMHIDSVSKRKVDNYTMLIVSTKAKHVIWWSQ